MAQEGGAIGQGGKTGGQNSMGHGQTDFYSMNQQSQP